MPYIIYSTEHDTYHSGGYTYFEPREHLLQAKIYSKDYTARKALQRLINAGLRYPFWDKSGTLIRFDSLDLDDLEVLEIDKTDGSVKERLPASDFMQAQPQNFRLKKSKYDITTSYSGCLNFTSKVKADYQNKHDKEFKTLRNKDSCYSLNPDYTGQMIPYFAKDLDTVIPWGYVWKDPNGRWNLTLNPLLGYFNSDVRYYFKAEFFRKEFDLRKDAVKALKDYFLELGGQEKDDMVAVFHAIAEEQEKGRIEQQTSYSRQYYQGFMGGQVVSSSIQFGNNSVVVSSPYGSISSGPSIMASNPLLRSQSSGGKGYTPNSSTKKQQAKAKPKKKAPSPLFSDDDIL